MRRTPASTTGPTAAGRAWCCWPSRCERALAAVRAARAEAAPAPLVSFSPAGRAAATRPWSPTSRPGAGAILLCARYEGIDQRFVDAHVDLELSLGDYVLSGGELPALALLDAVARLQPGRARRRALARAGQLLGRPARLPALQPPRAPGRRRRRRRARRCCCRATTRAIDALAARAVARADRRAPPRPDRRRRAPPGLLERRRRGVPGPAGAGKAIISGFSILCRAGARSRKSRPLAGHTANPARAHDRRSPPWT